MSDQNKETQSSKPIAVSEELKQQIVAKVKELFERENFKKNIQLTAFIINPTTNAISLLNLFRDKSFLELCPPQSGVDIRVLEEIFKRDELKSHIIYNHSDQTIAPTWKKLRNILYINAGKEYQALIEEDIKTVTTEYKLETTPSDTIKVTVNALNQEETLTSALFNKLFNKTYTIPENKPITVTCAIEEEQFVLSTSFHHPPHTYKTAMNSFPNTRYYDPHNFQVANPSMIFPAQLLMMQKNADFRQQQFRNGKPNRNFKQLNNPQFVNKNGVHYNGNAKAAGNNLHQPANHVNNKLQTKQGGHNNKGGKFNKTGVNKGGKQSQKLFNPSEGDFPSLQ